MRIPSRGRTVLRPHLLRIWTILDYIRIDRSYNRAVEYQEPAGGATGTRGRCRERRVDHPGHLRGVTGELRGDLYRQGRQIGWIQTSAGEGESVTDNSPMAWGRQSYQGYVFVSDMNSGLWAVRHDRPVSSLPRMAMAARSARCYAGRRGSRQWV